MIWPRQYGKSYELGTWWLEDPQNRAIVTGNEMLARCRRRDLEERIAQTTYGSLFLDEFRKLLKSRVMSYRSWPSARVTVKEVAVDDLEVVLQGLLGNGGTVVFAAGAGVGEPYPDTDYRRSADEHYERIKNMLPPDDPDHRRP